MIPRFKYAYNLRDAFKAVISLTRSNESLPTSIQTLFPNSSPYFISSARLGIKHSLTAFKLKKGAKVGVQPYTCSSVLVAIKAAGYTPCFIDIDENLTLSIEDLSQKINEIDALIITHTFGFPAKIAQIKEIAENIPVIEDCAHALFSEYQQQQVGTFFDVSVFSFGNGKFPSLGAGGLLVVNNAKYIDGIEEQLGQLPKPSILQELKHIFSTYFKALLHSKGVQKVLNKTFDDAFWDNRNKTPIAYEKREYQIYKSTKSQIAQKLIGFRQQGWQQYENGHYLGAKVGSHYQFLEASNNFVNYFFFVILADERDKLYRYLRKNGIMAGKHFQHSLNWASTFGYQHGDCPIFEKQVDRILAIPCYYGLSKKDLAYIAHHVLVFKKATP